MAKSKEDILLERIRKESGQVKNERTFGECSYRWDQWKMSADEVRTTVRTCRGVIERVAVSCPALKVNVEVGGKWGNWRWPEGPEANMVAALCAHVVSKG